MPAGVYIHIPFCKSRCSYCDFATDVYRSGDAVERYVAAICKEISGFPSRDVCIDTIYFGGGTPSMLSPEQIDSILRTVRGTFDVFAEAEITMEMNPATVSAESLHTYQELGINRASFGVQTFNEHDLKLLARGHDANDVRQTFRLLRDAGFKNVSFDLIAGLPGQSMDDWSRNLEEAISMRPEHLSLYLLEVHEGTPLADQLRSGRRPMPDEEVAAEMYELMIDTLEGSGYRQYEISNFTKPGFESKHNTKYWRMDPVYGFGVSAHSFDGSQRYANDRDTNSYVDRIERTGVSEVYREAIDPASESVFLGLRLNEGIDLKEHRMKFGVDLTVKMAALESNGLVEINDGRVSLTRNGMLFSNEVFAVFV
ncbi:MAG: radical SAM family heme chaperone HemW [Pyrinomonadaceae bacterium]